MRQVTRKQDRKDFFGHMQCFYREKIAGRRAIQANIDGRSMTEEVIDNLVRIGLIPGGQLRDNP